MHLQCNLQKNLLIQTFDCQSVQDGLITLFSKYISCCLFTSPEGSNFSFHNVLRFQFCIIYAAPGFLGVTRYGLGKISFVSYSLLPHSTNPGTAIAHKMRCISIARLVICHENGGWPSLGYVSIKIQMVNSDGVFARTKLPPLHPHYYVWIQIQEFPEQVENLQDHRAI